MPLRIARKVSVDNGYGIDIARLRAAYPRLIYSDIKVRCYVNKIYNPESELVSEPRELGVFPIWQRKSDECYLNLKSYVTKGGIPDGHTVELLAINLVSSVSDSRGASR